MILKERETDQGLLVAACDSDVLGETFRNGEVSVTVTEEFYGSEEVTKSVVADRLAAADVANLVGAQVVELAIEEGHVERENVLQLDGTVHAQFLKLGRE